MNKDLLKKHHFWVLFGIVPLLILLAVILTWTGGGGAIAKNKGAVKADLDTVSGKKPKGKEYEAKLEEQKKLLQKKREELWQKNWEDQRALIVWPKDGENGRLKDFLFDPTTKTADGKLEFRKFGSPLPEANSLFNIFTRPEYYPTPFKELADSIQPTQIRGGWQTAFRHIRDWGQKTPDANAIWLTLEDLWIQRGLMIPIKEVNDLAAAFEPIPVKGADGKALEPQPANKFAFRSRIWEVEFEIETRGSDRVLLAKITNITDRLQLLGAKNAMTLNVWFDTTKVQNDATAFPFRIEGEFVRAGQTVPVNFVKEFHQLDPGANPTKIEKVKQVFDGRTVPIRRLDALQLGKTDQRHQYAELKLPSFIKPVEATATQAGPDGMGGPPVGSGPPRGGPPGTGSSDGFAPGSINLGGGGAGGGFGGVGWESFVEQYKLRYLDVTEQVRRMPVAMVLVIDQAYERDLLIALANSKLRFQITQYHSKRTREAISTGSVGSEGSFPGGPGAVDTGYAPGSMVGSGFGGDEERGGGRGAPGRGGPPGLGSMGAAPGGPPGGIARPSGPGPGMPSGMGEGIGLGGLGGDMGFGGGTGLSDSQASSGLVEISVYGVVTLYERYVKPKAEGEAATPEPEPTPSKKDNTVPEPKGETPMPAKTETTPMPADKPKE